ncbi:MAG: membrane lipoprotein lipid attachment site-containing protein [Phycisphaerales bacterium]|nr:membrane lipoprotein lipid attachment site-containing protein [Phycisphaerales bacterium]
MKRTLFLLIAAGLLTGCQSKHKQVADWDNQARGDTNEWMLRTYFGNQVTNGIVRQHTLYPHHFVDGAARLTERGERDLAVLARHYAEYEGGVLVMPRGGLPDELYERRLAAVRVGLARGGVEPALVEIDDDTWTGETTRSTRAGADFARPSDDNPFGFHADDSDK